jgi:16S rRNA (guanine527-N7)-methyltransferase
MFHVKHDGMGWAAEAWGISLPDDRAEVLTAFEALLAERSPDLGLVARADLARLRDRHILDCLRSVDAIRPSDHVAVDIGSGGGLPGIVVAIARPELRMILSERRRQRVAFLELAADRLDLRNVRVVPGPVEAIAPEADVAFARAFSDLRSSWAAAEGVLAPRGRLVYFAGRHAAGWEPPAGVVTTQILPSPSVASAGPLVIMSRQ